MESEEGFVRWLWVVVVELMECNTVVLPTWRKHISLTCFSQHLILTYSQNWCKEIQPPSQFIYGFTSSNRDETKHSKIKYQRTNSFESGYSTWEETTSKQNQNQIEKDTNRILECGLTELYFYVVVEVIENIIHGGAQICVWVIQRLVFHGRWW